MLAPVLLLGYINIFIYCTIILLMLILVSGGYFAGYWNFSKKKASAYNKLIEEKDKRKETLKLNSTDKAKLMLIDSKIEREPSFVKGVIDFHVDGKKIHIY